MSDPNQKPRKFVLDKWFEMNFIRFMRGLEPLPPTFSVMPSEIIDQVVEKMEPIDRLRASKVCRSLRTTVNKFGLRFGYISLELRNDEVQIWFGVTKIIYTNAANGNSIVNRNGQESIIDGENFMERAAKDFKIVSKHAKRIVIWNETKDRRDIFTTFAEFFCTKKFILVEEIELHDFSSDEILTILPCFDAEGLKKIKLESVQSIDQFEQITHLEQWKSAEELTIWTSKIASTMIDHFFHFKCFFIHYMDEISVQSAIQMRDDLLKRSAFQSCEIFFKKSKINPIEIAKIFKPDYAGGNVFKIEYSNSNDKFDISLLYYKIGIDYYVLNVKRL